MINNKESTIIGNDIEEYLTTKDLNLLATIDNYVAYKDAEYVMISTPTNYDPEKNYFNTKTVEAVIANILSINPNAVMVIKSTVPVGYTERVKEMFGTNNTIFSPEFLREGKAYMTIFTQQELLWENSLKERRCSLNS